MFECELLKAEVITYVLSLAFQVAGAVLLIIKYLGRTRERIIEEYFPGSNVAKRDGNNTKKGYKYVLKKFMIIEWLFCSLRLGIFYLYLEV